MIRRVLCTLCAVLLLLPALPVRAAGSGDCFSYDFDLTFSLNAESFPRNLRARMSGYADLVRLLGLKGNIAWNTSNGSMELDATLYFRDNPSLSYPVRVYGIEYWLFFTSPLINNEEIFLDLGGMMEYFVKVKNYLNVPLPYLAFLYPYTNKLAFSGLISAWDEVIGSFSESGEVTVEQLWTLSDRWDDQLKNHAHLQRWISALAEGSGSPAVASAVRTEFSKLPYYFEYVSMNHPLSVTVSGDTEIWKNAADKTLFFREKTPDSLSMVLSLPASENRYVPYFSYTGGTKGDAFSFDLEAFVCQDGYNVYSDTAAPEEETAPQADVPEGGSGDAGSSPVPDLLLYVSSQGHNLPAAIPSDSGFDLFATVRGDVYPNYSFCIQGETKKDGSVNVSLSKPFAEGAEPVVIFSCEGTVLPAEPREIPDYHYQKTTLDDVYNIFAFNEKSLADFRSKVVPQLIRSLFSFVEAAPTSACQSFLDDLTDSGVLDMLLD